MTDFDVDDAALLAFTQQLVQTRSVHEPENGGNETDAAELVAGLMREFGWQPQLVEVAPGRPNVLAVIDGRGGEGPTLAFEGHTDVVTEGRLEEWTVDPFGGEVRDGRLYGRGSADMKSGVASMLFGVRALEQAGPFPGRIALLVLCDEEGMMLGAKHFAAGSLATGVDACIVCEPEGDEVCTSAKGAVRLLIELRGAMAHGAMPRKGRNPIRAMGNLLVSLAGYEDVLLQRHGEHEHLGPNYVTPTVLEAGSVAQINVIPATARVAVDIRTIPGVGHDVLIEEIGALADEAGAELGVTAAVEVVDDRPPVEIEPGHPVVQAVVRAHETEHGVTPAYGGVPGATDGTILWRDARIPNVVYGPGDKWIAHQADEWVAVEDLGRYARVYARAAHTYLTESVRA